MKEKKIFIFLLGLIVFVFGVQSTNAATFNDVFQNHKFFNAIEYTYSNNIISGYPDNNFKPNKIINRAEFTKILIKTFYSEGEMESCMESQLKPHWSYVYFTDVWRSQWFAKYICTAKDRDIIRGFHDGSFKPNQSIKFSEAAKIIVKTFNYQIGGSSQNWYQPYIDILAGLNVIPDSVNAPDHLMTRGEVAEIIYKLILIKNNGLTALETEVEADLLNNHSTYEIKSELLNYIQDNQRNSRYWKASDCIGVVDGKVDGGDLISTLIVNPGLSNITLDKFTPEYLDLLKNKVNNKTKEDLNSKIYAYKACNLGEGINIVAGYLWDKESIPTDSKGNLDWKFYLQSSLAITHGDNTHIVDDTSPTHKNFSDQETVPCDATLIDKKVIWSCADEKVYNKNKMIGLKYKNTSFDLETLETKSYNDINYLDNLNYTDEELYEYDSTFYSFKYPATLGTFDNIGFFKIHEYDNILSNSLASSYNTQIAKDTYAFTENCSLMGGEKLENGCLIIKQMTNYIQSKYCFKTNTQRLTCIRLGDKYEYNKITNKNSFNTIFEDYLEDNTLIYSYLNGDIDPSIPQAIRYIKFIDKTLNIKEVETVEELISHPFLKLSLGLPSDKEIEINDSIFTVKNYFNAKYISYRYLVDILQNKLRVKSDQATNLKNMFSLQEFINILDIENIPFKDIIMGENKVLVFGKSASQLYYILQVNGYEKFFLLLDFEKENIINTPWYYEFLVNSSILFNEDITDLNFLQPEMYLVSIERVNPEQKMLKLCPEDIEDNLTCIKIKYPTLDGEKIVTKSFYKLSSAIARVDQAIVFPGKEGEISGLNYKVYTFHKNDDLSTYAYFVETDGKIIEISFEFDKNNFKKRRIIRDNSIIIEDIIKSL